MIHPERIQFLNEKEVDTRKKYVLYWMQASQRAEWNHALEYAIDLANRLGKPLLVFFGLTDSFPEANERHYAFMLEGLKETKRRLADRGIRLVVRQRSPETGVIEFAKQACSVVVDRGYLRIERQWRKQVAESLGCQMVQVESNVIVPVEAASPKEAYSAGILRKKIHAQLIKFAVPLKLREYSHSDEELILEGKEFSLEDIDGALEKLRMDRSVKKSPFFFGGVSEAYWWLEDFIENKLGQYGEKHNEPSGEITSNLSPYLHFGQISPLGIFEEIKSIDFHQKEEFLEQLIVRRELSMNFVFYNENYDSYDCLPEWAKKTLAEHSKDSRSYMYSLTELETGKTHDFYWNAAQLEMVMTGKMQGYMRMYWGKKILEWSKTPEEAFERALYLNNKYSLDGRDPNGFAGVAWCFGKHDRPWQGRPIFGMVRYMNDRGLERKFDMEAYIQKIENLFSKKTQMM